MCIDRVLELPMYPAPAVDMLADSILGATAAAVKHPLTELQSEYKRSLIAASAASRFISSSAVHGSPTLQQTQLFSRDYALKTCSCNSCKTWPDTRTGAPSNFILVPLCKTTPTLESRDMGSCQLSANGMDRS